MTKNDLNIPLILYYFQHIAEKIQAIQKALTYRYSSHDVDKILASKEKFSKHPHNYAMFKAKLMKERDQYKDMGNQEEVRHLLCYTNLVHLDRTISHINERF